MKRSARQERNSRNNSLRSRLNLAKHPLFTEKYGEIKGRPMGYYSYTRRGVEVILRYSQERCEWLAICSHFKIETSFPHQPPQDISILLDEWLADHIEQPQSPDARLRARRPAVSDLVNRHGFSRHEALEIYQERGR